LHSDKLFSMSRARSALNLQRIGKFELLSYGEAVIVSSACDVRGTTGCRQSSQDCLPVEGGCLCTPSYLLSCKSNLFIFSYCCLALAVSQLTCLAYPILLFILINIISGMGNGREHTKSHKKGVHKRFIQLIHILLSSFTQANMYKQFSHLLNPLTRKSRSTTSRIAFIIIYS
jgi:hypothetical protein